MKTGTLLTRWASVLCALLLMISLFALPVFAEETTTADVTESTEAVSETESESAETESSDSNGNTQKPEEDEGLNIWAIIWIVAGAIVLIVAVVLGIKFRANIAKGLRVYKSEFKKVSWLSAEQTRKSTLVVVILLVAFAAVICLLDMGLFKLFDLMLDAFKSLFNTAG
ncbi:MAG: preprotein translocase subunit SecE [Ruminococcaceae bacterium]|nr:preprotein translocase subunit SecE [Oscillospiraceae bacterium]